MRATAHPSTAQSARPAPAKRTSTPEIRCCPPFGQHAIWNPLARDPGGQWPPDYSQFHPFPSWTSHFLCVGQPGAPMQIHGSSSGTLPVPSHFQHFTFFTPPHVWSVLIAVLPPLFCSVAHACDNCVSLGDRYLREIHALCGFARWRLPAVVKPITRGQEVLTNECGRSTVHDSLRSPTPGESAAGCCE